MSVKQNPVIRLYSDPGEVEHSFREEAAAK